MTLLTSQRLKLTPFEADEVDLFHRINTSPFVRKYLWDDEVIALEMARELLAQNEQHFQSDKFGLWKITELNGSQVMGYTGLWYFFDESQPQLLYALLEEFSGQGYATEAARMVIQYAFNVLQYQYLVAATDVPNLASQRVAEGLGMRLIEKRLLEGKHTLFYRVDRHSTAKA